MIVLFIVRQPPHVEAAVAFTLFRIRRELHGAVLADLEFSLAVFGRKCYSDGFQHSIVFAYEPVVVGNDEVQIAVLCGILKIQSSF